MKKIIILLIVGFLISPSGEKKDNTVLQTRYDIYFDVINS